MELESQKKKGRILNYVILSIIFSSMFGLLAGAASGAYFYLQIRNYLEEKNLDIPSILEREIIERETITEYLPQTSQEQAIIDVVQKSSPAVVSIIITKDIPIIEQYFEDPFEDFFGPGPFLIPQYREKGTERREVGGGTGFIISEDGMILTNKHVVSDENAEYTVFLVDGKKFSAKVLAKDPIQDIAILKISQEEVIDNSGRKSFKPFPIVEMGNSNNLQIGQTVITIGNALGELRNTVSSGVISGLGRTITASGGGTVEVIEDVIQTDAAINQGNSGGPLLNLKGEVIGINTAMAVGAQSIGFAIPINQAKKAAEQVRTTGKIVYPFLGVRYLIVNSEIQEQNNLPVDYGALVMSDSSGEPAVFPGSGAHRAGIIEGDIILEFEGEKISINNSLAKNLIKYSPGDKVNLKILRNNKELDVEVILGERE